MKNRIRAELIRNNLLTTDLASILNISVASVSNKLNGHTCWTDSELKKLSECLKVSIDYLIKGE